jgi:hypothetical protein
MLLDVIESAGSRSSKRLTASPGRSTNRVDDIPGACVGSTAEARILQFTQKPHTQLDVSDIRGTRPAPIIPSTVSRPSYALMTQDIPHAQPKKHNNFKTERQTDPLNPSYTLPRVAVRPVTPPKSPARAIMEISDIDGTAPAPLYRFSQRKTSMDMEDIEYATPGWKPVYRRRQSPSKSMDVKDINGDGVFKTQRTVDPQSPRYRYDVASSFASAVQAGQSMPSSLTLGGTIGSVHGNHTKQLHRERVRGPTDNSLRTDDVEHCAPGEGHHVPRTFPRSDVRRQVRNINFIADIDGTHAKTNHGTFAVGTQRHTDPLQPTYGRPETIAPEVGRTRWREKQDRLTRTAEIEAVRNLPS